MGWTHLSRLAALLFESGRKMDPWGSTNNFPQLKACDVRITYLLLIWLTIHFHFSVFYLKEHLAAELQAQAHLLCDTLFL